MQPLLCPSCTQKCKSLQAHTPDSSHAVPYFFPLHSTGAKDEKDFSLFFFLKKRGKLKNSWDMCRGKRFWDDQQRSLKDLLLCQMCVKAKCKCVFRVLGEDGLPRGGLLSVLTLCHLSSSPPPIFPGLPGRQIQPGIDFWLRIHIFLCPNLANTNLTTNNTLRDCSPIQVCSTPPWTFVAASPSLPHTSPSLSL